MKHTQLLFLLSVALLLTARPVAAQRVLPEALDVPAHKEGARLAGTRYYAAVPKGFAFLPGFRRYQRDSSTYLFVLDAIGSDFLRSGNRRADLERNGDTLSVFETLRFNGFGAVYFEGPLKAKGRYRVGLHFGDNSFETTVVGISRMDDAPAQAALRNLLRTSWYDKSFPLDPLEGAGFRFDAAITGFKLALMAGDLWLYTPDGKQGAGLTGRANFQFNTVRPASYDRLKAFFDDALLQATGFGSAKLSEISREELLINGARAIEVVADVTDSRLGKNRVHVAALYHEPSKLGVLFVGTDAGGGSWSNAFRATVRSIRF